MPPTTTEVVANVSEIAYYPISVRWDKTLFSDINNDTIHLDITHDFNTSW